MSTQKITRDDIIHLFGEVNDHRVVEILETDASLEDLEEAASWLADESDVMGEARLPLTGRAGQVYEILARDKEWARQREE